MSLTQTMAKDSNRAAFPAEGLVVFLLCMATYGVFIVFIFIANGLRSAAFAAAIIGTAFALLKFRPEWQKKLSDMIGRQKVAVAAAVVISVLSYPVLLAWNPYWIHIMTVVFIYAIMAQGVNIHLGEMGAINVGYAGFFAIGTYAAAILLVAGYPFWIAMLAAVIACWLAGAFLGACVVRTTGDYLALVTLGFGFIVYQLVINMEWLTRGPDGIGNIPKPNLLGHSFGAPLSLGFTTLPKEANFYYLALVLLALCVALVWQAKRSWIGRIWSATRQDSLGVSCFGVNVPWMRVFSFAFGAAFGGVAGALYASEIGFVSPEEFTIFLSITVISMVILGGMANWWGVLVGSLILIVLPEKLREFAEYRLLLYGIVLLLLLIYRPHGLFPSNSRRYE